MRLKLSMVGLVGVLAVGCGGRAIKDGTGSSEAGNGATATPTSTSPGTPTPKPTTPSPAPGAVTTRTVTRAGSLATFGPGGIGIAFYPPKVSASTHPFKRLGSDWQTNACQALAFDSIRDLYVLCHRAVASQPPDQVVVFDAAAQDSDAPKRIVTGPSTTLAGDATDLAVSTTGKVYVVQDAYCEVENCNGMVSVFAAGANGNSAPVQVIQGPHTGLTFSAAIAVDAAGLIYVGNAGGGPLLVFAADASGDVAPLRRIGRANEINEVTDLVVDASGEIYVANALNDWGVLVYGPSAAEGDLPVRVIGAPSDMNRTSALALDSAGRLLVSDQEGFDHAGSISIFDKDVTAYGGAREVLPNVAGTGIAVAP